MKTTKNKSELFYLDTIEALTYSHKEGIENINRKFHLQTQRDFPSLDGSMTWEEMTVEKNRLTQIISASKHKEMSTAKMAVYSQLMEILGMTFILPEEVEGRLAFVQEQIDALPNAFE